MNIRLRAASAIVAAIFGVTVLLPTAAVAAEAIACEQDYVKYSVEQLTALITKLTKQRDELKNSAPCFVSDSDLSLGDGEDAARRAAVVKLQNFLKEKGFFKLTATGYFGKITQASLVSFQEKNGLAASGAFDAPTREKAHAMKCRRPLQAKTFVVKKPVAATPAVPAKPAATTAAPTPAPAPVTSSTPAAPTSAPAATAAPVAGSGPVQSITLSTEGVEARWTVNGYSKNGFNVIWSKAAGPTYPTRAGDRYIYMGQPGSVRATLFAPDGASGAYRVRVCENLGQTCGVYSNEAEIIL